MMLILDINQHVGRRLTEAQRKRLAVINSQDNAPTATNQPMPKWGWGETKGPYQP